MLDFFTIFSKGGIVLWYFQGTSQLLTGSVNELIKNVFLQERVAQSQFNHDSLVLKHSFDNEFELVFVVAYQNILKLSYVDKFLDDVQRQFRDKYKECLQQKNYFSNFDFQHDFEQVLKKCESEEKAEAKVTKSMKSFDESQKSKKTVASMIENKKEDATKKAPKKGGKKDTKDASGEVPAAKDSPPDRDVPANGVLDKDAIRQKVMARMKKGDKSPNANSETQLSPKSPKSPPAGGAKKKEKREWLLGGKPQDAATLDMSKSAGLKVEGDTSPGMVVTAEDRDLVGKMGGDLQSMDVESSSEEEDVEGTEDEGFQVVPRPTESPKKGRSGFGFLSSLRSLVGSRSLAREDIEPIMEKMKDHLIGKNVASDIAVKVCESVAGKLEGKVLGTFQSVSSTVKAAMQESMVQILTPKRRVDILRDVMEAQKQKRPFVITFCGVNGVGKSTNLAKITFWLIENGYRVLIAACDTFRSGAVEQLRTHCRKLNALHPPEQYGGRPMVQLYEKGYGKDPAGIAMEAINYARDTHIDVVMVDTAGRMQDNEPLMRALTKLIAINQPDLVLFVGEALVGNEAVDQLVKFNRAMADFSQMENPRLIDGILLTKFDTIDDKVGAAISMTYITGQPIVFVGTGQSYGDLKNLNAKAVVTALLK